MSNRRDFIRRGSLWTLGALLATDLEVLDRLTWTRTMFPSADFGFYGRPSVGEAELRIQRDYCDAWARLLDAMYDRT